VADLQNELRDREEATRVERHRLVGESRDVQQALLAEREQLGVARQELAQRPTLEALGQAKRQLKMLQR
jgi:hypothetical protein